MVKMTQGTTALSKNIRIDDTRFRNKAKVRKCDPDDLVCVYKSTVWESVFAREAECACAKERKWNQAWARTPQSE